MALTFVQVDEITTLLRHVPQLVDRMENRRPDFEDGVHQWLKRVETVLEANRLPSVSQVAACRAMLLQAARGYKSAEIVINGKPTARKIRDATATLVLHRCNQLLHEVISERQIVFQEADRLARQLIAVSEANGTLYNCRRQQSHQDFLLCLQKCISADPNLLAVYTHLVALVGKIDVLIALDRAVAD